MRSKPGFSSSSVLQLAVTAGGQQPQKAANFTCMVLAFEGRNMKRLGKETDHRGRSVDKNAFKLTRVTVERHNAAKV